MMNNEKTFNAMLKMPTLMDFRILLLLPFLWACKNSEEIGAAVDAQDSINGTVRIEHSFCGGHLPPGSNGIWYDTMPNTKFIAFKGSLDTQEKYEFTTDQFGKFSAVMPVGEYQVFYADKIESPKKFLERKNKTGDFYKSAPSPCSDKWLKTPEFTFYVGRDKDIQPTIRYRCFVADNPCLEYVGPAPP